MVVLGGCDVGRAEDTGGSNEDAATTNNWLCGLWADGPVGPGVMAPVFRGALWDGHRTPPARTCVAKSSVSAARKTTADLSASVRACASRAWTLEYEGGVTGY